MQQDSSIRSVVAMLDYFEGAAEGFWRGVHLVG